MGEHLGQKKHQIRNLGIQIKGYFSTPERLGLDRRQKNSRISSKHELALPNSDGKRSNIF
jgi:hypothetical protein